MLKLVRRATLALLVSVLALFLLGTPVQAGVVTIQYGISGGTLNAVGLTPTSYIGGGTLSVRYTAASLNSLLTGPSTLVSLNVTNAGGVPVLAGSPGTFPVTFLNISFSAVSGGRVQSGIVSLTGTFPCTVALCGFSGPVLVGTGTATFAQWTTGGQVTIGQTAAYGGFLIPNISIYTGQEVSRSFVPEPTSGTLLTAGLLGLAGLSAIARRRR